ncbi:uncharacterized protein LOC119665504 [Teleopsis dalmanni]|nr:uncharacterized protein LOC119665504 [Teleopsis dalmanni]
MSTRYFNQLALRKQESALQIQGVGSGNRSYINGRAVLRIFSTFNASFDLDVEFYIINKITSAVPVAPIMENYWQHLRNLPLVDPKFGETDVIDALLGCWVVFGPAEATVHNYKAEQSMALRVEAPDERVDDLLHRLFESKETDMAKGDKLGAVDLCECIFMSTHKRFDDGSYCVQIPFTPDAPPLGNSHQMALRQFHQLERKLASNPELTQRYVAFMREYEQLGHMHPIQHHSSDPSQAYYIPHHAVMAKFRVVFNASAKTSNGISLNDTQLDGPPIQDLLLNLLLRFRQHRIAFTADVEKMFRQVKVDERNRQW